LNIWPATFCPRSVLAAHRAGLSLERGLDGAAISTIHAAHVVTLSTIALTLLARGPCAFAATALTPAPQHENGATEVGGSKADGKTDSKASAQSIDSRINTSEVGKRVSQELGVDLEATIAGWQRELGQLEKDLSRGCGTRS
jgi:potassium efflux system protein